MRLETALIKLRRITKDSAEDVEHIRTVRNSYLNTDVYSINHFIGYDEHVQWFRERDSLKDFYFLIIDKRSEKIVGWLSCDQKNSIPGSGEISIFFVKDNNVLLAPFHAMALLLYFVFDELKLKSVYGLFHKKNGRAIRFNSGFGFKEIKKDETMITTELGSKDYSRLSRKLKQFLTLQGDLT